MNKHQIEQITLEQLSKDFACSPDDFLKRENTVVKSSIVNGRRQFVKQKNFFRMANFGYGTVISVDDELLEWANEHFYNVSGLGCFTVKEINYINNILDGYSKKISYKDIDNYYLPNPDRVIMVDNSFKLKWFEREDIPYLFEDKRFVNALMYDATQPRFDILAVAAMQGNIIIGLAGASNDSDLLWQIGIDVMPEYKNKGIATTLVSALSGEILKRGAIPYYGTTTANIASRKVANKCGYYPAWVEYCVTNSILKSGV